MTEAMEALEVAVCRNLAVQKMAGTRDGSGRPAWKHAEDVAETVQSYGWIHPEDWRFWVCVAWLHDLLEDVGGMTLQRLAEELIAGGILPHRAKALADSVRILSKSKGETEEYFQRIQDCGQWQLSLIKILDRLANLTEGRKVFVRKRWNAYVEETERYVVPLVANVDSMLQERLLLQLGMAMVR